MKRGEIRWYRFASPDKKRPVVILTRDSALRFLGEVTIAPITTTTDFRLRNSLNMIKVDGTVSRHPISPMNKILL